VVDIGISQWLIMAIEGNRSAITDLLILAKVHIFPPINDHRPFA
jgi:hypothetical protein